MHNILINKWKEKEYIYIYIVKGKKRFGWPSPAGCSGKTKGLLYIVEKIKRVSRKRRGKGIVVWYMNSRKHSMSVFGCRESLTSKAHYSFCLCQIRWLFLSLSLLSLLFVSFFSFNERCTSTTTKACLSFII